MSVGSSYATVKQAIIDMLGGQDLSRVAISSQAPIEARDVNGPTGDMDAIWVDAADGEYTDECFRALPLSFDETYGLKLILQSLRPTKTGTQLAADLRVDEMLYEVLSGFAADPTLGCSANSNPPGDVTFNYLYALPVGFQRVTGFLPTGAGHGSRCELTIEVKCRHTFP